MLADLRLGVRLFSRHPGLSAAAVLSLALGIGANTAIFSVLHAVVLSPLPFPQAEALMAVWESREESPTQGQGKAAPANFLDWRRSARSFEALAAYDDYSTNLTDRGVPERLRAAGASGNFFTTLGIGAAVGRTLLPSDDAAGAAPVAVLSDGLATRLFGAPSAALDETLMLDGRQVTVVGVLPSGFSMATVPDAEIWTSGDRGIPRSFPFPGDLTAVRDSHYLNVVGRLAPGVTRAIAQQELSSVAARLAAEYPDSNAGLGITIQPLHETVVGDVRPLVVLLQLAVAVLLVIACANVANLLLGQAARRQSEMATRVALGAGRGRIVRQLLAETLVLAVPGGVLGLLLAVWGLDALVALAPPELPRAGEIGIDTTVLAFTAGVTLLTALAFGLGPALRTSHFDLNPAQGGLRVAGGRSVRRWHHAMAIGELALAQALLVGAGLLVASFGAAERVDLGFEPQGRIAADLSLSAGRYLQPHPDAEPGEFRTDTGPKRRLIASVLERMGRTPGVTSAAAALTAPMAGTVDRGVRIAGQPEPGPGLGTSAGFQIVSPDYFRALGMTLIRGRAFEATDRAGAPPVAVVNQAFVSEHLRGIDPLGEVLIFGGTIRHEIVGVVADARYRAIESPAVATFYIPFEQNEEGWPFLSFTVATTGEAAAIGPALREAVHAADPDQPIARMRTYDEILSTAIAPRRFNMLLVGIFALTALVLAAVGAYGVLSFAVTARTREIGVRTALGASPGDIVRLVVRQGIALTAVAIALGLGGGLLATRFMETLLFEVTPTDPRTYGVVAGVLTIVALTAVWIPARRATAVNPITALREE